MKNHSRLTALLLCLILLLSSAACSGGEVEETTEIASTTAPETTEAITEETTEEVISVVVPPETTDPPETEAPKPEEIIRIIMQDGVGEAIISALAEDEFKPLLDGREKALLYGHSAEIELSKAENLEKTIENTVLSGTGRYDLILTSPLAGIGLLNSGLLENLASAGISITPDRVGINKSLTESLSVGGGVYLFSSDALVSDTGATYAIRYSGDALSSDPVEKTLAGEFTAELLLTYDAETSGDNIFLTDGASPLVLYHGLGGNVFTQNEIGIPSSAVSDSPLFRTAYDEALKLYSASASAKENAIFRIAKLSSLTGNEIHLPLPKATLDAEYVSPMDHTAVSIFAAPAGVISGSRLCALVDALNSSSHEYRETIRKSVYASGAERSAQTFEIIESHTCLDVGTLFGWGDISEHIENGLKNNKSADEILADRLTEMRNKAAETAASILAGKLGIE